MQCNYCQAPLSSERILQGSYHCTPYHAEAASRKRAKERNPELYRSRRRIMAKRRWQVRKTDPGHIFSQRTATHQNQQSKKVIMKEIKIKNPCQDCGRFWDPVCMSFDHRAPADKAFDMHRSHTMSWANLIRELKKCDVVCLNCHALRTMKQREAGLIPNQTPRTSPFA